jgi:hypothetical protein
MKSDEKVQIITIIKVAILFVRLITTIVVVVANFIPSNANTIGLALKFTLLAILRYMISTVHSVIQ